MRKMRKTVALLLVTLLLVSLTACTKSEQKKTTTKKNDTGTMSGILESFSGGIIKMKSDETDHQEFSFEVKEAKIECKNMLAGDEIVVVYDGEINGTDTSNVKVEKVIDDGKPTSTKEATIVGTVVAVTTGTIQIKTNDGKEYTFTTIGAEQVYKNGVLEGNWVTITYVGELQGTDATGIKVIKITDDDANVIQKEQKKMKIKDVDETVYATAGVHIRESYTTHSKIVGSLAQGSSIQRNGVCENGWSRVNYKGSDAYVYGDYLTTTAPTTPVAPATTKGKTPGTPQTGEPGKSQPAGGTPTNQDPPTQPEVTKNKVSGIVENVAMSTMTVLIDSNAVSFDVGSAQHNYKNGIQRGNEVNITYTGTINGTDTSGAIVVAVEDSNANSTPTITGTIENATMNTVSIKTDDGASIAFSLDGVTVNCANGILVGNKVTVTMDMNATVSTSNIFPATQIDDVK
ncbi:MAG: hypothetical protein RSA90_01060 [Lachnospiraceae bacterium]